MMTNIRAELRKLFSVRSTYVIIGIALALEILFAFWAVGLKADKEGLAQSNYLITQVTDAVNVISLLIGLVAILLITHEYRHNTITYTLTASKSRTRVFMAKFLVISVFAVVFAAAAGALAPLLTALGIHLGGHDLVSQNFSTLGSVVWRSIFAGWAFTMLAFILAFIIRAQVGAIAAMFLGPATVEPLLGLLLKKNAVYLPFGSVNGLTGVQPYGANVPHGQLALVIGAYVVVGSLVAWWLFRRRDAN